MKKISIILLFLLVIVFLNILLFYYKKISSDNYTCYWVEKFTVRGTSMSPMISDGEEVELMNGYYSCYQLSVGDIVVYNHADGKVKLIKKVMAAAGDSLRIENGNIFVNNTTLKNSQGIVYKINSKILDLFAHDYPIVSTGSVLLLGDNPVGSLDGSVFGLVSDNQIVGRIKK